MKKLYLSITIIALCSLLCVESNAMTLGKRKARETREADDQKSLRAHKKRKLEHQEEIKDLLMQLYDLYKQFQTEDQSPNPVALSTLEVCMNFVKHLSEVEILTPSSIVKSSLAHNNVACKLMERSDIPLELKKLFEKYFFQCRIARISNLNLPDTNEEWRQYIQDFENLNFKNYVNLTHKNLNLANLSADDLDDLIFEIFQNYNINFLKALLINITLDLSQHCLVEWWPQKIQLLTHNSLKTALEAQLKFLQATATLAFANTGILQNFIILNKEEYINLIVSKAREAYTITEVLNLPGACRLPTSTTNQIFLLTPLQIAVALGRCKMVERFMQLGANPYLKLMQNPKKDCFDLISLAPQEKQEELRNIMNNEIARHKEFYEQTRATLDETQYGAQLLSQDLRDLLAKFVPSWPVEVE